MPGGTELEVKLSVPDARIFDSITKDPEIMAVIQGDCPHTLSFEAFYFDTPGFTLQKKGFAYRVRREGEKWVATLKSDTSDAGGLFSRQEWNENAEGPEPSLKPFADTHIGETISSIIGEDKLGLLFSTRFLRIQFQVRTAAGSLIELAFDRGNIWSGAEGVPICELELELKNGTVIDLLNFSARIADRWHLYPEVKSKYARGLELLAAKTLPPQTQLLMSEHRTLSEASPVVLSGVPITNMFSLQKNILDHGATKENVRELRIQCRRLRSLLRFFQPLLSKEGMSTHIEHLRQWGILLGSIRDIDVFVASWQKFSLRFAPLFIASNQCLDLFRERREFLSDDILHRINQGELTQHLFSLQEWLYTEQDRLTSPEEKLDMDYQVRKMLLSSAKKLRDEISELQGTAAIGSLHRFRIRAKQLRYVQESLNDVSRYRDAEFSAALKKIQSQIGNIHDAYQTKSLIEKFDAGNADNRFILEKELFISWRSSGTIDKLASLSITLKEFRRSSKQRLRTLATLRSGKGEGGKPRQNSCTHEPGE